MPKMLTTAQAAARLGVGRRAIIGRVERGTLTPADQLPGRTGAFLFEADQIEYVATYGHGTDRGGDVCGCPDDRCIGYHHDADTECGCNRALNAEDAAEPRVDRNPQPVTR